MANIAFWFSVIAATVWCDAATESISPTASRITVHGRLSLYNGTPSFRIWVIGTKRILGVSQAPPEIPYMPIQLERLVTWENFVFGDFTIVAQTKDTPGEMRMVRIVSARNLVITDEKLAFIRRVDGEIAEERTQTTDTTAQIRLDSP